MSSERREQISALLDGELSERETGPLLIEMRTDPELRSAWSHYHLVGDALCQRLPDTACPDISGRVSLALEHEPACLPMRRRLQSRWKPAAGLAMAAALAGVGFFSLNRNQLPEQVVPQASTIGSAEFHPLPIATVKWNGQPVDASSRLSAYIVNHQQFNSSPQTQGLTPYFRVVTHETQP
ncbi:MAG: sigma-E factor negative regulatory protein [Gammaproteobacteria bacterium]